MRSRVDLDGALHLASSSARGGLRVVAIGLVPELTAEAARQAALGAGAKIVGVYSHELTRSDVGEIEALRPDLLLLAGGTDGGNRTVIEHNVETLAASALTAPVIVAGNRIARDAVLDALHTGGKRCYPHRERAARTRPAERRAGARGHPRGVRPPHRRSERAGPRDGHGRTTSSCRHPPR